MYIMGAEFKKLARMAFDRLSSGFWQNEQNKRETTLAILARQGADTAAAKDMMVANTKQQLTAAINPEDEALYARVKTLFLAGNGETALSVLIDQEKIKTMDDSTRQRYIFNLSAKLQEFRDRFAKEQQFSCQTMSM